MSRSVSTFKQNRAFRRAARLEQRRLAEQIAELVATPSGRSELDAIMRRHSAEENAEIDAILGSGALR